jgi:hypothetical protein
MTDKPFAADRCPLRRRHPHPAQRATKTAKALRLDLSNQLFVYAGDMIKWPRFCCDA